MAETSERISSERVGDRLRAAAAARVMGRSRELEWLERALLEEQAKVVFVHGVGGIGKTALLDAAEASLHDRGVSVLRFAAHEIEPTPAGLLRTISGALGGNRTSRVPSARPSSPSGPAAASGIPSGQEVTAGARVSLAAPALDDAAALLDALVQRLEAVSERKVVLALDDHDGLRLTDAWLRQSFLPALPAHVHLLALGRGPPVTAWTALPDSRARVRVCELGPLSESDARQLLEREPLSGEQRAQVCRIAAGHPLALKLAASVAATGLDLPIIEIDSGHVLAELGKRFVANVREPAERSAIEVASVLRRVTKPLLRALLGAEHTDAALDVLRRLPFVDHAVDGLVLHSSIRQCIETDLRTLDPLRHRQLRAGAWRVLAEELREHSPGSSGRRWQVIADVVHLLEHAEIREAFFPSDPVQHAVEPATARDREAILSAAERVGSSEAQVVAAWWQHLPHAFTVVRDDAQNALAYSIAALAHAVPQALLAADPVAAAWQSHRLREGLAPDRPVLFNRLILSVRQGLAPSEERASASLDINRLYMQHPDLAAVYVAAHVDLDLTVHERLGFRHVPELAAQHSDGARIQSAVLNFGPGVLDWLGRAIDAQTLFVAPPPSAPPRERAFRLDRSSRQLIVDDQPRALTRFEYAVFDYLDAHRGAVASRDQLLEAVWGQSHSGNTVVDAVVRALRKKLGSHAAALQTVTGFGYKLRHE